MSSDGIVPAVNKTHIDLAKDRGRGIDALKGSNVPAVFCDAVKVQLRDCVMLFISGKLGVKADGTLAGRTMREQTQRCRLAARHSRRALEVLDGGQISGEHARARRSAGARRRADRDRRGRGDRLLRRSPTVPARTVR
jgi:hypothetical protein